MHYLTSHLGDEATEILTRDICRYIKRKQIDTVTIQLTTPHEVQQAIKHTKQKKNTGKRQYPEYLAQKPTKERRGATTLHYIFSHLIFLYSVFHLVTIFSLII